MEDVTSLLEKTRISKRPKMEILKHKNSVFHENQVK